MRLCIIPPHNDSNEAIQFGKLGHKNIPAIPIKYFNQRVNYRKDLHAAPRWNQNRNM